MQSMPGDVKAAFDAFPREARSRLVEIRTMILAIAAADPRIGTITETLKWGEPAYLTEVTGSGSTIRLGLSRARPDCVAVYFICRTSLVDSFRERFGDDYQYEGTRAVLLPVSGVLAPEPLGTMLAMALTYHLRAVAA
jgi:hypothetical protein